MSDESTQVAQVSTEAAPVVADEMPPSCTVYVRNLSEDVKIDVLKTSLDTIFSTYGTILSVVAHKNIRMRGQAFVVFDSIDAAQSAIEDVQGFPLFDKPMVLQFAKKKSDATIKREAGEDSEEFQSHKKARLEAKERRNAEDEAKRKAAPPTAPKPKAQNAPRTKPTPSTIPDTTLPPHRILFLQNLPPSDETTNRLEVLTALFGRFPGFKEVRMVPGRKGLAFVEYETDGQAAVAKEGNNGVVLEDKEVVVSFGKKT
ncbi:RNA-binding domain-containing protein [Saitoella complicata NRRL Y-17804]|uniref:RNA-binding domain-containing protein n=1 Tax=Saitoella complicata (strain BCRC 22490 / CBS 7301 / JCM 7358 / NBRC 10748 / NRRL Y-17804) TaxID=698492 RepID=UPI0008673DE8|nr:RNA-binding domain-containing protein [Saitoella complicata NRRL Y-17804]ODQ53918.1 RNA-binding domain-containing protein [Saitoella complicata NRRL Y-17804]